MDDFDGVVALKGSKRSDNGKSYTARYHGRDMVTSGNGNTAFIRINPGPTHQSELKLFRWGWKDGKRIVTVRQAKGFRKDAASVSG